MTTALGESLSAVSARTDRAPTRPWQPCYETLLHRLRWPSDDPASLRTLGITSSLRGEGVSTVAAHLSAVAAIHSGRPVLLVDAHFQDPSVHRHFGVDLNPGFAEYLQNRGASLVSRCADGVPGLSVVGAGKPSGAASRAHDVYELAAAVKELSADFALVVFDMPPVNRSTLALRLASVMDGVVFVVEAEKTRKHEIHRSLELLKRAKAQVLGSVFNKRPEQAA